MSNKDVAIIGPGRVGSAVGRRLHLAGYVIRAVAAQSLDAAQRGVSFIGAGQATADAVEAARAGVIVLITTPDDEIGSVCSRIADGGGFRQGQTVVHFSGMLSSQVLASARKCGAAVASCHPMQSFATAAEAVGLLETASFSCEGAPEALADVREMVAAMGGVLLDIPTEGKAPYHIGAVFVSNYIVALADAALGLYEALGLDRTQARKALAPLMAGTLRNVERLDTVEGLTGPIARGDVGVVKSHLDWLRSHRPDLVAAYLAMGRLTLAIARRKGAADADHLDQLDALLGPDAQV